MGSTEDEAMAKGASREDGVVTKGASTADEAVATGASATDESVARDASTSDEAVAKNAPTADEAAANGASAVNEAVARGASEGGILLVFVCLSKRVGYFDEFDLGLVLGRHTVASGYRDCDVLEWRLQSIVASDHRGLDLCSPASFSPFSLLRPPSGIMIPIPQYPIYSALIDLLGGRKVGYYLDEEAGWDLNVAELERALADARAEGTRVAAFVLINPGNPTGQVLSARAVRDITAFCAKHGLVLLADEVYQENVYNEGAEFVSCKKAAADAGLLEVRRASLSGSHWTHAPVSYAIKKRLLWCFVPNIDLRPNLIVEPSLLYSAQSDALELVSFHSTSKGLYGECGRRGGYMELSGIDGKVKAHLYKKASASLCR